MARGSKFVKNGLLTSNILFLTVQILIAVLGFFMVSKVASVESQTTKQINAFEMNLAVNSCVMIGLILLGCCAAVRENLRYSKMYAVLMAIGFVVQTEGTIKRWHIQYTFPIKIDNFAETIWNRRDKASNHNAMDILQLSFNCCGVQGFDDYLNAKETIPNSCCGKQAALCDKSYAFKDGCANTFSSYYKSNFKTLTYVTTLAALIELIAFIFACCFVKEVRNKNNNKFYPNFVGEGAF